MNRPGTRLHAVAARIFDASTLERLIDPLIADLQCEHADAERHGRRWRARWVHIASVIAFWKVAALAVFAEDRRGARALVVAMAAGAVVTALGIAVALADTPATIHARGNMAWLILYLVPQALALSLPVCLAFGLFIWLRGEDPKPVTKRTTLWMVRLGLMLAFVNIGWIIPAANTAFRDVVAGEATVRGPNELTLLELGQRIHRGSTGIAESGPLPMTFWLNARLALAIAPVLLSVLALAGAAAVRRRSAAVIVFGTLAVFVGCYVLIPDSDIATLTHWLPAAAIAWIPNAIVALATVNLAR